MRFDFSHKKQIYAIIVKRSMRALRAYFYFWGGEALLYPYLNYFFFSLYRSFHSLYYLKRYYICEMKLEKSFKLKSNWNFIWNWNFHFLSILLNILKYENLNKTLNFTFSFKLKEIEWLCNIYKLKYFENLNEIERFRDIMKFAYFFQFEIIWDIYNEIER